MNGSRRARQRLRVIAGTAAMVALTLIQLVTSTQPAAAAPDPTQHVWWSACEDGFQCGTLSTPLDYDRPDGVKVSVSVIRLPASSPGRRIGSLVFNPGGPGVSGVDFVRQSASLVPAELRARFDLVGFDPRGVGRSSPLRCFATLAEARAVAPPFAFPATVAEERQQAESDRRLAAACARRGGPILHHMSTADTARDLDLLRQALGDDRLSYVGRSYGSVLGQTYANLFPRRVRAMVIDGVVDPIAWTTGYGDEGSTMPLGTRLGSDVGAQATLDEFFRLCDVAGPSCAFAGNSHKRFASLAGRLREHPIVITDPAPGQPETFSYQDLIMTTLGVLFDPALWPIGGVFFAEIEALASTASVGHTLDAIRTLSGHAAANQEPYANDVEGLPGVACSDSANPRTLVAWQRAAAAAEHRQVYFGRRWAWKVGACLSWPTSAGEDRYQGPWNAWTSGPVLVVGNYFDPATPYSGAVTVSKLLPNSRLLSYAGWGHTAFLNAGNVCVDNHIARYLINAQVPPTGTVCQPDRSPFAPPEASAPTAS